MRPSSPAGAGLYATLVCPEIRREALQLLPLRVALALWSATQGVVGLEQAGHLSEQLARETIEFAVRGVLEGGRAPRLRSS